MHKLFVTTFFLLYGNIANAQLNQKIKYSVIKVGIAPGAGTSGENAAFCRHSFSFNLLSGLSAGNDGFEIGTFSNYSLFYSSGIQLAGLINIVGGYKVADMKKATPVEKMGGGFHGIQFAGLINSVGAEAEGLQVAGLSNTVRENFVGLQVAGVYNYSGGASFGIQLSGAVNFSKLGSDGMQVSSLVNSTIELKGIQISSLNYAKEIPVLISKSHIFKPKSLQIGLMNFSEQNFGIQVGLINYSQNLKGVQIGLINFNNDQEGIPIGLLNLKTKGGYARTYANELFVTNFEFTTGSKKIQNALSYSINPIGNTDTSLSAFAYGLSRINYWNRGFFDFGTIEAHYLRFISNGNVMDDHVASMKFITGKRVDMGRFVIHFHAGISLNFEFSSGTSYVWIQGMALNENTKFWPGALLGIHFR